MVADINPGIREYTRVFVLPSYKRAGWNCSDVLLSGKAGRIWLLSTDENVKKRFYKPPNGQRDPNGYFGTNRIQRSKHCSSSEHARWRAFIMGGCTSNRTTLQEIDIYNVKTDSWKKIDTGIRRGCQRQFFYQMEKF